MAAYDVVTTYDGFYEKKELQVTFSVDEVRAMYQNLGHSVDLNDPYAVVDFMLHLRRFSETGSLDG